MTGITIQAIADLYLGVYIKFEQASDTTKGASDAALAFIFIQAFGYTAGKYNITVNRSSAYDLCRTSYAPVCVRSGALAEQCSFSGSSCSPSLSLVLPLCHDVRTTFASGCDEQLQVTHSPQILNHANLDLFRGRIHLLRRLVCDCARLRVPDGSRDLCYDH